MSKLAIALATTVALTSSASAWSDIWRPTPWGPQGTLFAAMVKRRDMKEMVMTDRNGPGDDLKSLLRLKNWLIAINTILLIVLMGVVFAWAGPLPQPKLGATCPAGYEASGNYCMANGVFTLALPR